MTKKRGKTRTKPSNKGKVSNIESDEIEWYERVFSESDINDEIISELYHLKMEPCAGGSTTKYHKLMISGKRHGKNCSNNPSCLNGFGQYQKVPVDKIIGFDPADLLRSPNQLSGLKCSSTQNLGATCYMNSLLQCLYANEAFRSAIYRWKDSEVTPEHFTPTDHEQAEEDSENVPLQLQMLFARLQLGPLLYADPTDFAKSIEIPHAVQQDPQEFFKLLLSLLEERYSKELVQNHFVGKYQYVTVCSNCKNASKRVCDFTELELPIKGHSHIEECIKEYTKEEILNESNQYLCDHCNSKQDAARSIEITQLPEVLNFQFLRFVYDKKTGSKKKLKTRISFPESIDMSPFVVDQPPGLTYDLKAVIVHRGASAYGGHYIVHVKSTDGKWWKFDDETVVEEKITSDEVEEETKGKKKEPKQESKPGIITNCNAYLLIYNRHDAKQDHLLDVPEKLIEKIMEEKKSHEEQIEVYRNNKIEEEGRQLEQKEIYNLVWNNIRPLPDEAWYWIDTNWFSRWVKGEFAVKPEPISNGDLMCPHDKADPQKVTKMKRISAAAWDSLHSKYGGGPILSTVNDTAFCRQCIMNIRDETTKSVSESTEKQYYVKLVTNSDVTAADGYLIDKDWWNEFKKQSSDVNKMNAITEGIVCEHGNLNTEKSRRRLVSKEVWDYLSRFQPSSIAVRGTDAVCQLCGELEEKNEEETRERQKAKTAIKKEFSDMLVKPQDLQKVVMGQAWNSIKFPLYIVNGDWYRSWSEWCDDVDKEESEIVPMNNEILLCPHDRLRYDPLDLVGQSERKEELPFYLISAHKWTQLKERDISIQFIDKNLITNPEMCSECVEEERKKDVMKRSIYEKATLTIEFKNSQGTRSGRVTRSSVAKSEKINDVNSSYTIQQLKLLIFQSAEIMPRQQKLTYEGTPLEHEERTLEQYGILAKSTVVLEIQDADEEEFIPEVKEREEGFAGTGLMGKPMKKKKEKKVDW
ncbi:ubiquitin carboxyl-terminal hydrolase 48, partial [Planoprotostelium fungivorum]